MTNIVIFSGDDIISSRKAFLDHLESLRQQNFEEIRINGKDITEEFLENVFGSQTLFAQKRILITENFLSGQKTKEKEKILAKVLSFKDANLVCWENKDFSANERGKFPKSFSFKNFKLPSILFKFLENLRPSKVNENLKGFRETTSQVDPNFFFLMFVRQIRLLILAQNKKTISNLPSWQIAKLQKQVKLFKLEKLIEIYKKLLQIDYGQKTSSSPFSLIQALELLILDI